MIPKINSRFYIGDIGPYYVTSVDEIAGCALIELRKESELWHGYSTLFRISYTAEQTTALQNFAKVCHEEDEKWTSSVVCTFFVGFDFFRKNSARFM